MIPDHRHPTLTTLAQSAPPSPLPPLPQGLPEWGLLIALLIPAAKVVFDWFKAKDQSESELMRGLIQDLRDGAANSTEKIIEFTGKSVSLQERTTVVLEGIQASIKELTASEQAQKKDLTIVIASVHQISRDQVVLTEKLEALHRRLDRVEGIPGRE